MRIRGYHEVSADSSDDSYAVCVSGLRSRHSGKVLLIQNQTRPLYINLDDWYAKHPVGDKKGLIVDTVYASPRTMVTVRTGVKGWVAGPHYHATTDEGVIVVGGKARFS